MKYIITLLLLLLLLNLFLFGSFVYCEGIEDLPKLRLEFTDLHLTDNLRHAKDTLKGITGIYCVKNLVTGAMYIGSSIDLSLD